MPYDVLNNQWTLTPEMEKLQTEKKSAVELQQRKHDDWLFMRGSFTVNTVASDGIYAYGDCTDTATSSAITAFRDWHKDTFKIYLTSGLPSAWLTRVGSA